MALPAYRSAAAVAARDSHGDLEILAPGRPDYTRAEALGFERLPDTLRSQLRMRGLIPLSTFAVWADDPLARRRHDGSHYQQVEAWWATESRLVVCSARRELAPFRKGRLRPTGPWVVGGAIHELAPAAVERSSWRYPSRGASASATQPASSAAEPLDLLPSVVTGPVLGGESRCFLLWGDHWAEETVIAHRVIDGRVRLLRAVRTAADRGVLVGADWVVDTVDAAVVRTTVLVLGGDPVALPSAPQRGRLR